MFKEEYEAIEEARIRSQNQWRRFTPGIELDCERQDVRKSASSWQCRLDGSSSGSVSCFLGVEFRVILGRCRQMMPLLV